MKVFVVLLGLITATFLSGVPATSALAITIRAYNNTGELDLDVLAERGAFTLGTSVLLTCDVTGRLPGDKVINYTWEHNCSGGTNGRCEIQDRDPYYRVVNDTLLADVTSWDQGGKYYCTVHYLYLAYEYAPVDWTSKITVAGNPLPFLYTPTSLLPEHSVLTDVQQATGTNGQQWITCKSGEERTRPEILMENKVVLSNNTDNSARIGLDTQHPNGLYHCLSAQSQRQYFSLFLMSSVTLPTPNVSVQDNSVWTLTSPDRSRVERYIVEFECSVRNITFVEKYMSVSASGGTGRLATCVSCFGGLGQLYRVKVWAVSGPSISRALVCIPDGQCREEGGKDTPTTLTATPARSDKSPSMPSATMQPGGSSNCTSPTVIPISIGALLCLVGIAAFTAGVVMLVRAKRVLHHSSQPPPPGTDHYEMVNEGEKKSPPGAVVYKEVDKQNKQTGRHTKHYQELDPAKMERREYVTIKV